jgi:hypothetical protein
MYVKPLSSEITNNSVFLRPIVSEFSFLARAIPYLLINDAAYASGEPAIFFVRVQDIFYFYFLRNCKQTKERKSLPLHSEMPVSMGNSTVENRRSKIIALSYTANLRYISREGRECPRTKQK